MLLSEFILSATKTLKTHGDLPVTVLRSAGRTFEEIPVSGFIIIADENGTPLNLLIEDCEVLEIRSKVFLV